jgi:hypothetical protein
MDSACTRSGAGAGAAPAPAGVAALPPDVLEYLVHFLAIADVCSLRRVSREVCAAASTEALWEGLCVAWGSGALPRGARSWRAHFAGYVYPRRAYVPRGAVSIFNQRYFCVVEEVVFTRERVGVRIYERGDGSLGLLQDPDASRLEMQWALPGLGGAEPPRRQVQRHAAVGMDLSLDDRAGRIVGVLWYPAPWLRVGAHLRFVYGEPHGGYSAAEICHLSPDFVRAQRLGHFGYRALEGHDAGWRP